MRVVRPYDSTRLSPTMPQHRLERLEHVLVAQVPGRCRAVVHHPIVALGVGDDFGIALCVEESLRVMRRRFHSLTHDLGEHVDDRLLAVLIAPG